MSRLQYLFSELWSVRRSALNTMVAVVAPCIASGNPSGAEAMLADGKIEALCSSSNAHDSFKPWSPSDSDIPEGTVVVFRLTGMLFRWMTADLSDMMDSAESDEHVAGIILVIDGPGGMAGGVPALAEKIRSMSKPVATVVRGEMCSAHLWLGVSAQRVFVSSRFCEIGSIGSMTTFTSFKEYYSKNGIIERDIYPDTSDLKNREYRDLEENGDDTAVKERLETLHREFVAHVAACRGLEPDITKPHFRGLVMKGNEAVEIGLADQIGGMEDALRWIEAQRVIRDLPEEYR